MTEPCELSATEARRRLDGGSLTAESLARSCLERIAQREPAVRAWEVVDADGLLAATAEPAKGLLAGLPLAVKDLIDTATLPTTYGSSIYRGCIAGHDASIVALAKRAGAIVAGKTVTTEFACFQPGKTVNPHDPSRTPGGSSSGSAAAVAAGMVPLALGTQTAGSIIRPASFCGVFGYKPTFGWIERAGVKPLCDSLDTIGIFARTAGDCALFAEAVTRRPLRAAAAAAAARRPVVGLCRGPAWDAVEPEMSHAFAALPALLRDAGFEGVEVELSEIFHQAHQAHPRLMAYEAARALAWEHDTRRDALSDRLLALLDEGWSVAPEQADADLGLADACRRRFPEALGAAEVLVTPAAPGAAPLAKEGTGSPVCNRLWTLLHGPCIAVPGLRDGEGLPLGLQVVGPVGADAKVLAVADRLSAALR